MDDRDRGNPTVFMLFAGLMRLIAPRTSAGDPDFKLIGLQTEAATPIAIAAVPAVWSYWCLGIGLASLLTVLWLEAQRQITAKLMKGRGQTAGV